jgi:polysaccharide pyruvyl transferase WcaK-like protein
MTPQYTISFLSTLNTNIGDEFIRDGMLSVVDDILGKETYQAVIYNKHQPWTFFPPGHPARIGGLLDATLHRGWRKAVALLSSLPGNQFRKSDLIIQSGTPVIWNGASHSEWAAPFWRNMVFKNLTQIPVLNIGGGSCYAWSNPPAKLEGPDRDFARLMVQHSTLTTCREPLAAKLLSEASGQEIPVIECPGFLAAQSHEAYRPSDNRILINAMPVGGHFDYMKQVNADAWRKVLDDQILKLKNQFKIEFVCHDEKENAYAAANWPSLKRHHPASPSEYFHVCAGAHAAITNRLHAAVGLSGLGIPCIAMGTDTRLLMTQQIGIPSLFVPDVTPENLSSEIHSLLTDREDRSRKLLKKRAEVFERYRTLLQPHLDAFVTEMQTP